MDKVIKQELNLFEEYLKIVIEKADFNDHLKNFLFSKSKRLRSLLGILFCKAVYIDLSENHKKLFSAVEFIHNASLIHDDVIDCAKERRNKESLNCKFDNNLAVVSGDLLLSYGLKQIVELENKNVQNLCVKNMINICKGELDQYFSKYTVNTLEEYIEKSRKKTALLFETSVLGGIMLSDKTEYFDIAVDFTKNFGIAFQIKNDLDNYLGNNEDFKNGIYTAPIILGKEKGIEKTSVLINNYLSKAKITLEKLPVNGYSQSIFYIIEQMVV